MHQFIEHLVKDHNRPYYIGRIVFWDAQKDHKFRGLKDGGHIVRVSFVAGVHCLHEHQHTCKRYDVLYATAISLTILRSKCVHV